MKILCPDLWAVGYEVMRERDALGKCSETLLFIIPTVPGQALTWKTVTFSCPFHWCPIEPQSSMAVPQSSWVVLRPNGDLFRFSKVSASCAYRPYPTVWFNSCPDRLLLLLLCPFLGPCPLYISSATASGTAWSTFPGLSLVLPLPWTPPLPLPGSQITPSHVSQQIGLSSPHLGFHYLAEMKRYLLGGGFPSPQPVPKSWELA